jgi:methionyl aminopeptidase
MTIDDADDLAGLRRSGTVVAAARDAMVGAATVGMTTLELDAIGRHVLDAHGARSAPQLAYEFPGTTCISILPVVAHGIPSDRRLVEGDVVNIDVSAELDGYWTDTGISIVVGEGSALARRLVETTHRAQADAMAAARAGARLRSVGAAVRKRARRAGFTTIANLTGHGVGRFIHEEPSVATVACAGDGALLHEGLVIAIEPFLSTRASLAFEGDDGWALEVRDESLVAQVEHTIVVMDGEPEVITASAA